MLIMKLSIETTIWVYNIIGYNIAYYNIVCYNSPIRLKKRDKEIGGAI